jgi:polyisoprenyl-phosphate glycosyltransferase
MIDFSIVVPCYNEAENIKPLIDGFASFIKVENAELIIVDNGSNDETPLLKIKLMIEYPFIKWVEIKKNTGYGNGIYTGLKIARGKYLGYTHADLQTDPADVKKAMDLMESVSDPRNVLIKGFRRGRSLGGNFFSKGMDLMVRILLKRPLTEINAQPNLFTKNLLEKISDPPPTWEFDLYLYYIAVKTGCEIKRFEVAFPKRKAGKSKWNTGFFARISLSVKMFKYCLKLKRK